MSISNSSLLAYAKSQIVVIAFKVNLEYFITTNTLDKYKQIMRSFIKSPNLMLMPDESLTDVSKQKGCEWINLRVSPSDLPNRADAISYIIP